MGYSIETVARMTGISAFTLRNWEKRYAFLRPKRLDNGFRAYDDEQVSLLRKVSALLRHGARIGDLAETIRRGRQLPELSLPRLAPEVESQGSELYASLTSYDLSRALSLHAALEASFEPADLLDWVYEPLLFRIAVDRNAETVSPAQEHFASAFLRQRLAALLTPGTGHRVDDSRKVICATACGELHDGGLMVLAAHLRIRGWTPYSFGSSLPIEELGAAVREIQPRLVCLSFSDRNALHSSLDHVKGLGCEVYVGGFGALTFDAEEALPPSLHLFTGSGRETAEAIDQRWLSKPLMR